MHVAEKNYEQAHTHTRDNHSNDNNNEKHLSANKPSAEILEHLDWKHQFAYICIRHLYIEPRFSIICIVLSMQMS